MKELVMYSRTLGCPYVSIAKKTLSEYNVRHRELFIDKDQTARQFVLDVTGFLSVPTLVIADAGENVPYSPPTDLHHGQSPRGINRGSVITEASREQLITWLKQHSFIEESDNGS